MNGQDGGYLAYIPGALVVRAQQDTDFAVRILNRETRADAVGEAGLAFTDELDARLDEIAQMSFQEAIQTLRNEDVARFA